MHVLTFYGEESDYLGRKSWCGARRGAFRLIEDRNSHLSRPSTVYFKFQAMYQFFSPFPLTCMSPVQAYFVLLLVDPMDIIYPH